MKVLFIGDSITDCGRNTNAGYRFSLGQGYPVLIASKYGVAEPGKYEFINTGISGNRIVDIYARIRIDCWNHEPDVISLLVGVNDVLHTYLRDNGVEADRFERMYDMLVDDTLKRLPNVKMILMEPFVAPGDYTRENYEEFRAEVKLRGEIVERIAKKYNLKYVPLQEKFDKACGDRPELFIVDGVHPSYAGHQLIADSWMEAFEEMSK
ncbi:MAG: SGNH/GDSL hydrolase family protein [Firmicutes bacterium]|nr:SGNH/GDSL hydrolase family protein [Bacillota bacterium]